MKRRRFLKLLCGAALSSCHPAWSKPRSVLVNDVHSQLNPTWVRKVVPVDSKKMLLDLIAHARQEKSNISLCGSRHAGGGQQFASDSVLCDMTKLNRVVSFDQDSGLLEVEAGIRWPELLSSLERLQNRTPNPWGISQKQTGGDHLTIGGALSANAHGQGLTLKPFISDVESFLLIDAGGNEHHCSRDINKELFRCVIGGYGLFGVIHSVKLRLVRRRKVERIVEMIDIKDLASKVARCIAQGLPYGDYQVNIDNQSDSYLQNGIFAGYRVVDPSTPIAASGALSEQDWFEFVYGAHVNKRQTFERYLAYFQASSGRVDWSDVWQSGPYLLNYHRLIDRRLHASLKATEVLTEIYVPRKAIVGFMSDVRSDFLKNDVNLIYSTIRFIGRDDESFLPWAKDDYACVIFNLHTVHATKQLNESAATFRRLIDLAINYGGSYYLTYHKHATKEQVLACYPQFDQFLRQKREMDPDERFQSDWYRHYNRLFSS